jgi:hypothetical protein
MRTSHWILFFERQVGDEGPHSVRLELEKHDDLSMSFRDRYQDHFESAPLIGTFEGCLEDIRGLMKIHPMMKWKGVPRAYSHAHNNCQHWAATMLLFVKAFADLTPGRRFEITDLSLYNSIMEVLLVSGRSLYHKSNPLLKWDLGFVFGGTAAVVTGVAAEATAVVSAPGIAGLLGFTTVVPTAMAATAIIIFPYVAAGTVLLAGGYAYNVANMAWWRANTMFVDPEKRRQLSI